MEKLVSKADLAARAGVSRQAVGKKFKNDHPAVTGSGKDARVNLAHPDVVKWLKDKGFEQTNATTEAAKNSPDNDGDLIDKTRALLSGSGRTVTIARLQREFGIGYPRAKRVYDAALSGSDVDEKLEAEKPRLPVAPPDDSEFDIPEEEKVDQNVAEYPHWTLLQIAQRFGTVERFNKYLDALKKIAETENKQIGNAEKMGELISREFVRVNIFGVIDSAMNRLLGDTPRTMAGEIVAMVNTGSTKEEIEEEIHKMISDQLKDVKEKVSRNLKKA